MAVSGVSASLGATYQPTTQQSDVRKAFSQLAQAIQAGDLSGAQTAYADLTQERGSSSLGANTPFSQALDQIGQALQNGDIAGAQNALTSLSQQARSHHHHHHHGGGAPSTAATPPTSPTDSTTATSAVNLLA